MAAVEKRTTASGQIRYDVRFRGPDRRPRKKTFTKAVDARRFANGIETDLSRGEWADPKLGRRDFDHWAKAWLATTIHLKPKTRESYESILNRHLLPRLEHIRVERIDHPMVLELLAEISADGAGPGTVRNVRDVLRLVLRLAQRSFAIKHNPVEGVRVPRSARSEMLFLDASQVMDLAQAITEPGGPSGHRYPEYGLLVRFASFTGLRAGEIAALQVNRVDVLRGRVEVSASASEAHGIFELGATKTYQRRSVPLPRSLCDDLTVHLAGRAPESFVFGSPTGEALRHSNFYRRHFKPAVSQAGLPNGLRFHDLRHTYAAMLVAQGAHPRAMMERLGHSTINVTLGTYGHLLPSLEESLTSALDNVYRSALPSQIAAVERFA